jgi:ParB family chromosome partitioning protein
MATTKKKAPAEKVTLVPLTELHERADHPIKMRDDDSMRETIESVKQSGVLTPGIVRPRAEGGYEIIAGRRRKLACEAAGLETMPVIIRELDDEQAIIEMVDSGIQREEVLPSEKAAAYKMKLEAIKRQGARTDLTSRQVGGKSENGEKKEAADVVGEAVGESGRQVQRYIRLTELSPELQQMVDKGKIAMTPAVELSYLKPEEQAMLVTTIDYEQATPSLSQAQRMKKLSQDGKLNDDSMLEIMCEQKKPCWDNITLKGQSLRKYFPQSYTPMQIENIIYHLLDQWAEHQQKLAG